MADLYHSVAVCFSAQDRGKVALQWHVTAEDAHRFVAEFRERLGEPVQEVTADADLIDSLTRQVSASGAVTISRDR